MDDVPNDVELQICEVRGSGETGATVTVRNLRGPVFRGARFLRVSDSAEPIDLKLTHILWYHRTVDEVPPGHTALVTLRGSGAITLRPPARTSWQRIEGRNPAEARLRE
jgi:hypothetical protein